MNTRWVTKNSPLIAFCFTTISVSFSPRFQLESFSTLVPSPKGSLCIMSRHEDLQRVLDTGIVAIIRASSGDQLVRVARALFEGGIDIIEVTFTTPGVVEVISAVRKELGNKILLGAGTVLDPETARIAILAGAEFLVSPCVNLDIIKLGLRYDKMVMPGAYTPTEIVTAWEAGADVVKLFPADIGGAPYLKALKGPLPQIRVMPTGGVNRETLRDFVKAGACAVGLGGQLVEKEALEKGDFGRIQQLAAEYVELMRKARA
jgi:2-dehydro-3-deoxyphosphogluconate aldolase/(4S)-4-hydroxy-2-oxoglutarate aldolase